MKRVLTPAFVALASAAVLAPAGARAADPDVEQTVAIARQATVRYHDVAAAVADGYVRVTGCIELPGVGGMGYHYLNRARAADPAIRPEQPEELVYTPGPDGRLELAAVEYFRADADQDPSTDGDRPSLAGVPFDGPMPGHAPGMPLHYDLHVWAWRANPAGAFSEWNPNVHC